MPALSTPAGDAGLLAALIVAGGVTLVVALGMWMASQRRASTLTAVRGGLGAVLGAAVVALVGLSVVALSPVSAQAVVPVSSVSSTGTSSGDLVVDVQLPTR